MTTNLVRKAAAVVSLLIVTTIAQAAPLNLTQAFPDIMAERISVQYTATDGAFSAVGKPRTLDLDGKAPPDYDITGSGDDKKYLINAQISSSGVLLGGVPGDDFVITGNIDTNKDGVLDYSGILLKGEVASFGYATGIIEFTFTIDGGVLQSMFGPTVGTILTPNSGFEGSFAANFSNNGFGVSDNFPTPVPAPGVMSVFSLGVLGLLVRRRAGR